MQLLMPVLNDWIANFKTVLFLEYHFSLLFFTVFGNSQNSDDKSLQDVHTVAGLQDQAQLTLSKYIQATYPTQPFRFGKLLLSIPTLKTVCGNTIAELFFRKTIGNIPIERLLIDMFKSSDFWCETKMSYFCIRRQTGSEINSGNGCSHVRRGKWKKIK